MQSPALTLRAPAEVTRTGYRSALQTVLTRLADFFFPCRHSHLSLPFNNRQTCLDCGATRLYLFQADFEHADAGIFIGKWRKATDTVRRGNARKLLHKASQLNSALNAHPFHEGMSLETFTKAVRG